MSGQELGFRLTLRGGETAISTIAELKKAIKETNTAFEQAEKGSEVYNELNAELSKLKAELKGVQKEQRQTVKEFEASKAAAGSYRQIQAETARLSETLRNMKIGDAGFEELQAQIKKNKIVLADFDRELSASSTLVGEYERGIVGALKSFGLMDKAKDIVKGLESEQQKLVNETKRLAKELEASGKQGGAANDKLQKEFLETQKSLAQVERELSEAKNELKGIGTIGERVTASLKSEFSQVGKQILGAFALTAILQQTKNLVGSLFDAAANTEALQISLETMLGSAERAQLLVEQMTEFAASTPFELEEIQQAGKQLLAFGFEAEQVIPVMRMLGDVSAGTGKDIGELTTIYGQVQLAGRLMGQDLMQFTNAGIPLIAELAKNLGVAESEIKDMVSAGEIGFSEVEKAFQTMSGEGGRFFNLMDRQSEGLGGQWSNLKDQAYQLTVSVGQGLAGAFSAVISILAGFIGAIRAVPEFIRENKEAIIALGVAVVSLNGSLIISTALTLKDAAAKKAQQVATYATAAAQRALNLVMRANPIGILISAVALLAAGLFTLSKNSNQVRQVFMGLLESSKAVFKGMRDIALNHLKGVTDIITGVFTLDLGKIRSGFSHVVPDFQKFGGDIADAYKRGYDSAAIVETVEKTNDAVVKNTEQTVQKTIVTLESLQQRLQDLQDRLKTQEIGSADFKKTQQQIEQVQKQIDAATGKASAKNVKAKEKEAELLREIEKIIAEEQAKTVEETAARKIAALTAGTAAEIKELERKKEEFPRLEDEINKAILAKQASLKAETERLNKEAKKEREKKADEEAEESLKKIEDKYRQEQLLLSDMLVKGKLTKDQFAEANAKLELKRAEELVNAIETILYAPTASADENGNPLLPPITKEQREALEKQLNAVRKTVVDTNEEIKKNNEKTTEEIKKDWIDKLSLVGDALSSIGNILNTITDNRIKKIEEEKEAEIAAFEERSRRILENENLTAEQRKGIEEKNAIEKAALEAKFNAKKEEEERKAFIRNKARSIAEIGIKTAVAVMSVTAEAALAAPFLIPGVIALGALQIANVAAQKYEEGGDLEILEGGHKDERGLIHGRRHSQGGVKAMYKGRMIEVEGGERFVKIGGRGYIMKRGAATDPRVEMLSSINQEYGGRAFGKGGSRMKFATGGEIMGAPLVPTQSINPVFGGDTKELMQLIREDIQATNNRIDRIDVRLDTDAAKNRIDSNERIRKNVQL